MLTTTQTSTTTDNQPPPPTADDGLTKKNDSRSSRSSNIKNNNDEDDEDKKEANTFPVVDILSVGSIHQPALQAAQQATFGSHRAVRHFYRATEHDDTEVNCTQHLTLKHIQAIPKYCHGIHQNKNNNKNEQLSMISQLYFNATRLMQKHNPIGWVCAQKRPFDGFYNLIQQKYHHHHRNQAASPTSQESVLNQTTTRPTASQSWLPDYLIVVDDDTWLDLDLILDFVPQFYPDSLPHAVAGCLMHTIIDFQYFTFPYGGFGIILNRQVLKRLLQPLYCPNLAPATTTTRSRSSSTGSPSVSSVWLQKEEDFFEQLACWRLAQNGIGELPLFRSGMSIADLMHSYVTNQEFRYVQDWDADDANNNRSKGPGFCFHSDMAWGYFISYFHLASQGQHRRQPRRTITARSFGRMPPYMSQPKKQQQQPQKSFRTLHMNRLIAYNGTSKVRLHARNTATGQCQNGNDLLDQNGNTNCKANRDAHVCHRITPDFMHLLHKKNRQKFPDHYYEGIMI
ncbi:hypothetical protein ACA910_002083 [Epithemia clementina (nom. ined.)]